MKTYHLEITSYGNRLDIILNSTVENLWNFIVNYKEPLPTDFIIRALSFLEFNEAVEKNYSIKEGKLLKRIPKYYRTIKITRIT